jgi:hypothetical protein
LWAWIYLPSQRLKYSCYKDTIGRIRKVQLAKEPSLWVTREEAKLP